MKAIPGHNGLGCISMDKTGESQRTSEANLNEPFNILVVTNSKRQATQKTKLSFSFVFIVGHLYTLSRLRRGGARDKGQATGHKSALSWMVRRYSNAGQNKVVSTK